MKLFNNKKKYIFISSNFFLLINFLFGLSMLVIMLMISSIMYKWLILEMYTYLFIYYVNKYVKKIPVSLIYYYIISSIFMIFMIYLMAFKLMNQMINNTILSYLFLLIFMFKLGMYPFSKWFLIMVENLTWQGIYFMITMMKLFPIIMMNELELTYEMLLLLLISSLMNVLDSLKYNSLKKILSCSSILQNFVFIIMIMVSKMLFFVYSFIYMILLFMIIFIMNEYSILNKKDLLKLNIINKLIYFMLIVFYMMLPPMVMFMLKWSFLIEFMNLLYNFFLLMIIYMFLNLIMMWNYFNMIKFIFIKNNYLKMNYMNLNKSLMFLLIIFILINLFMSIFMSLL
uniref:NADH-ubiquinone oxidoreductase chain 2 n=1 Tax=Thyreus decorus TaxID=600203 RepID=A0A7U0M7S3_9HYME|nr:NADH dehydrogenase subunit 2 [Thyreus decorus]QQX27973.1 NADH dehydrogenase subunit 2 [Thyreus decorus]